MKVSFIVLYMISLTTDLFLITGIKERKREREREKLKSIPVVIIFLLQWLGCAQMSMPRIELLKH